MSNYSLCPGRFMLAICAASALGLLASVTSAQPVNVAYPYLNTRPASLIAFLTPAPNDPLASEARIAMLDQTGLLGQGAAVRDGDAGDKGHEDGDHGDDDHGHADGNHGDKGHEDGDHGDKGHGDGDNN